MEGDNTTMYMSLCICVLCLSLGGTSYMWYRCSKDDFVPQNENSVYWR